MNDENRIRSVAFNISTTLAGRSYATLQTDDPTAIIAYGRFGVTLASGMLEALITAWVQQSTHPTAQTIKSYGAALAQCDAALATDQTFLDLLVTAANDPLMQQLQDQQATAAYWNPLKQIAITPRQIQTSLAHALLFDIAQCFGVGDGLLRLAEAEYEIPLRAAITDNNLSEQILVARVAELYKRTLEHYATDTPASARSRGNFWLDLIARSDWQLAGDSNGYIYIRDKAVAISEAAQPPVTSDLSPDKLYIQPTANEVRVRMQPVNGTPVASVDLGHILEVAEAYTDARRKIGVPDQWLYVRLSNGTEGYIAAWLCSLYQAPAEEAPPLPEPVIPPPPQEADTSDPEPSLYVSPIEDRIQVRTQIVDGDTLAFLSRGDIAEVLEPYDQAINKVGIYGQWLYVRTTEGITGYISARFFEIYTPTTRYEVLPASALKLPESPPTVETYAVQLQHTLWIVTIDDRIRVRQHPINGNPIAVLPLGEVVEVLEPTAQALGKIGVQDEWINIRTQDGVEGFVAAWYFAQYQPEAEQPEGPSAAQPEPETINPPASTPTYYDDETLLIEAVENGVRLRDTPMNGKVLATLAQGEVAEVREEFDTAILKLGIQGEWFYLRTDAGLKGYAPAWLFKAHEVDLYITPVEDRIRVRTQPVNGDTLGYISRGAILQVQEPQREARYKIGVQDQWLLVITPDKRMGYVAAWYFREYTGPLPGQIPTANMTGINIDLHHPAGVPSPEVLGDIGWVRIVYNVSYDPAQPANSPQRFGNVDLDAAFTRYEPIISQYLDAGMKVIVVLNHQTFGENAGYNWFEMDSPRWRELSEKLAKMAGQIATQYRGKGLIYQIWNEMDAHTGAHASVPLPAKDYAYMLTQAIYNIREADPLALIITGGHASGPASGALYARRTLNAMPNTLQPDGIACHPYGRGAPQSNTRYRMFGDLQETIKTYSEILPNKPIWITEWGVLNAPDESPSDIASYAREFITCLKTDYAQYVVAALWFAWAHGMDNGYGLVDEHGNPREHLTETFTKL